MFEDVTAKGEKLKDGDGEIESAVFVESMHDADDVDPDERKDVDGREHHNWDEHHCKSEKRVDRVYVSNGKWYGCVMFVVSFVKPIQPGAVKQTMRKVKDRAGCKYTHHCLVSGCPSIGYV